MIYSHKDCKYLQRLLVHLKPLQKQGLLDLWVDTQLEPGDKWREEIVKAIRRSQIAIFLVSADSLASDFLIEVEVPLLLEAVKKGLLTIYPLILKPCRFTRDKHFSGFQAFNAQTPLAGLSECEQEAIYDQLAEAVEQDCMFHRHLKNAG